MHVLADSLPYQPHTATGYGYSGLSGLLLIGAFYWILKSRSSNRSSSESSSTSSSGSKGNTVWIIALVFGSLWAFGKSQDNPGTPPPAHPSTVVTTPHKPSPSGSSCSLICFQPKN
jgi:hypothetical protein